VPYAVERVRLQKLKERKDARNARAMEKIRTPGFLVQAVMGWERYNAREYKCMPVVKTKIIRTMRDKWDEEKKATKEQSEFAALSRSRRAVGKHSEEGLAKTRKYLLEHLELKKVAMDFFPDYEKYLNDAGFSKI